MKAYTDFIDKCGEALLNAKEIYFAGGEPLATEEHYLLLAWLVKNKATNVRLRYNTNFSILKFKSYEVIEYWKEFQSVEILASIDASENLGEYVRKEMNWETILFNREKVRSLTHVKVKVAPTISVFNLMHLPDLYKQCLLNKFIERDGLYINILDRPIHYNIQVLLPEMKAKVFLKFEKLFKWMGLNDIPESVQQQFRECMDYMMADDKSNFWNKFVAETKLLDGIRNEKISDVVNY